MVIGIDCSRAFVKERTGTENYSYEIIRELLRLPESRTHHLVLFTRPGVTIPDWTGVSNVEVVPVPYRFLWTQVGLALTLQQKLIDVLWIPAHTLPIFRPRHLKTVVTIHGLEYRWLPEYKNLLQRWYLPLSTFYAASHATHLIAVSQFTCDQLVTELSTPPEKITVIHEGALVSNTHTAKSKMNGRTLPARYGLQNSGYLLTVGTVQPRKNLIALIQAYSHLKTSYPDLKLVIAGARGWITEDIYREPGRAGVQESVIFTGRVSPLELSELYTHALIYVQASLQEGFGLPVIEAMASGVPVVTSDGGALPEVVGAAGLTVKLRDPAFVTNFAAACARIVRDPQLRTRLVRDGRKRAAAFTWSEAARQTLKLLLSS